MPKPIIRSRRWWSGIVALAVLQFLGGCRTWTPESALTLPPPDYLRHAPTYFPPSPGIELAKESAGKQAPIGGMVGFGVGITSDRTHAPTIEDPYIAELLAILQETASVDSFLTTLNLLAKAHPDHRMVIPTVIRNAERLGIFADHSLKEKHDLKTGIAERITKAIAEITKVETGPECDKSSAPLGQIVPMQTWIADHIEERCTNPIDQRTPVLPPFQSSCTSTCEDPPDRGEILRMIARVAPHLRQVCGDDVEFVREKLVDRVDPPRFLPLIGPAQLHHCHWKCTIYYDEPVESGYPFPFQIKKRRAEVVYIDKDHLHLCVCKPEKPDKRGRP